jgi:hypothetical protein
MIFSENRFALFRIMLWDHSHRREFFSQQGPIQILVRTQQQPLQSSPGGRNNMRVERFVAGARDFKCGGWLAWFDGSSVRGCGRQSMTIQACLSHPRNSPA